MGRITGRGGVFLSSVSLYIFLVHKDFFRLPGRMTKK